MNQKRILLGLILIGISIWLTVAFAAAVNGAFNPLFTDEGDSGHHGMMGMMHDGNHDDSDHHADDSDHHDMMGTMHHDNHDLDVCDEHENHEEAYDECAVYMNDESFCNSTSTSVGC